MPLKRINRALIELVLIIIISLLVSTAFAGSLKYTYDHLNRLEKVEYPDGTYIQYTYDKIGNITSKITGTENQTTADLAVATTGTGSGEVTSSPAGISCGADCAAAFPSGTIVILTASPLSGSYFAGWSGGGCTGTDPCPVTLSSDTTVTAMFNNQQPVADFSGVPATAVQTVTVTFTDLSMYPISWLWDFGDGTTSTLQNPTHTYSVVGTYEVKLTATNGVGSNTMTKTGYIVVQPYVKISGSAVVYRNIQEAYDAAPDGATIKVRDLTLIEDFNANSVPPATPKTIVLEGGYDATFSTANAVTTLKGSATTTTGTTTIKNFILQK